MRIVQFACLVLILGVTPMSPALRPGAPCRCVPAQESSSFSLEGKVTEAKPGKLTINTVDNILFHVRYSDQTEIKRADGSDASAKDLRVGVRVAVVGDLEESGEIAAVKITVQETESKKP